MMQVGETDSICPYCHKAIAQKPSRKKKCPHCDEFIYVRTRPDDKAKVLVTEEQTKEIEAQWLEVGFQREWEDYCAQMKEQYQTEIKAAKKNFVNRSREQPLENDMLWSVLNDELLKRAFNKHWSSYRMCLQDMGVVLASERRFEPALRFFLQVCYLDVNGPDDQPEDEELRLLMHPEWKLFEPKGAEVMSGVARWSWYITEKIGWTVKQTAELFFSATKNLEEHRLPVSREEAWKKVREV